ncbi:craniofacial development protein 2-like, partial [Helicoverpa zea]|uniref:craniofacial development protein 2-like n=1 Tax=Helicoverpa zea TaxID=7113 RepID=UPI001F55DD38
LKASSHVQNHIKSKPKTKPLPTRLVTVEDYDHNPPTNLPIETKEVKTKIKLCCLYLCTLNTRTLRTPESLHELELATENIKWDILGISEMRRIGEAIEERSQYVMYHKGEIAGQRGVGFLIKSKLKNRIIGFEGISDRIAMIHINMPTYKKDWTIIQVYSPTEQANKTDIEEFYNSLSMVIEKYSGNNIVVMGDFNAQVGARTAGEEHVIGNFGSGERSKNGEKLVEFLLEHNLMTLNSMFRKKSKWTWISPDGKIKNEIDYILTNKPRLFSDTSVIKNLNFNTDHRMVRCCLSEQGTKKARPKAVQVNFVSFE